MDTILKPDDFAEVYESKRTKLLHYAEYHFEYSEQQAEDALHDAILVYLELMAKGSLKTPHAALIGVEKMLYTTMKTQFLDDLKHARVLAEAEYDLRPENITNSAVWVLDCLAEINKDISVLNLSEEQTYLWPYFYAGLKCKEVAYQTGKAEGAVRMAKLRIRDKILAYYRENWEAD